MATKISMLKKENKKIFMPLFILLILSFHFFFVESLLILNMIKYPTAIKKETANASKESMKKIGKTRLRMLPKVTVPIPVLEKLYIKSEKSPTRNSMLKKEYKKTFNLLFLRSSFSILNQWL